MSLEKIVGIGVGVLTLSSATVGCFAYGVSDAKGASLPGRIFVWPTTALGSFYLGRKVGIPDEFDTVGNTAIYLFATAGMGVVSYGLGYATGKLTDLVF